MKESLCTRLECSVKVLGLVKTLAQYEPLISSYKARLMLSDSDTTYAFT